MPLPKTNVSSSGPTGDGCSTTWTIASGRYTTTESVSKIQLNAGGPLARLAMKFHPACATADSSTSTRANSVTASIVAAPGHALKRQYGYAWLSVTHRGSRPASEHRLPEQPARGPADANIGPRARNERSTRNPASVRANASGDPAHHQRACARANPARP